MAGPQHGILGDDAGYGLDLPESQVDDSIQAELQKTARFSKTAEFKALKDHLNSRIEFYQQYLPGGQPINDVDPKVAERMWISANTIINEFRAVINAYEQAAQEVKDAATKQKTT